MNVLYKYRAINDNTLKMLKNTELYCSEPKCFNDPFDSYFEFDFNGTTDDLIKYFKSNGIPESDISCNLAKIRAGEKEIKDFFPREDHDNSSVLNISCFSEEPDNILLWSHYAKNHSGICIGFKTYYDAGSCCLHFSPDDLGKFHPDITSGIIPLSKVEYSDDMPKPYNRLKDDVKRLIEFVKTKSIIWIYEKEYRIILFKRIMKNNPIHFDQNEISEIIFGINADEKSKQKIRDIISRYKDNGKWINYYQCTREKGRYKIKLVKC
jgi:hypothetical protein